VSFRRLHGTLLLPVTPGIRYIGGRAWIRDGHDELDLLLPPGLTVGKRLLLRDLVVSDAASWVSHALFVEVQHSGEPFRTHSMRPPHVAPDGGELHASDGRTQTSAVTVRAGSEAHKWTRIEGASPQNHDTEIAAKPLPPFHTKEIEFSFEFRIPGFDWAAVRFVYRGGR
jgi:hypothetical protein